MRLLLFLFVVSNLGWCSVILSDPDNICKGTNEGSHPMPGTDVKLNCEVNNKGAYNKILTWKTPLVKMPLNYNTLLVTKSASSHVITYSGNISDTTLTVMMITENGDVVNYTAVINQNCLNVSSNATFIGNSTNNITLMVKVKSESANFTIPNVTLNHYNSTFSHQQTFDKDIMIGRVTLESKSNNPVLALSSGRLHDSNSVFSATATFNGNLSNSTLTFMATQSLNNQVVTCGDGLGNSKNCTLQIYSHSTPSVPDNFTSISVTYTLVHLSWNTPSDTGGYNTVNYIITVTPLDDSDPWSVTTTDNSYTVTGLMFGQSYNFTVRANNSIGVGEESNTLTVLLLGYVPHPVNVDICLDYIANGTTKLNISWNPCPPISNADTTPPVDNYTLSISNIPGYPINLFKCSHSQSVMENTYTVNITANNIVGPSELTIIDFNARWLTNVTLKNSSMAKVEYTTAVCVVLVDLNVQLTYNNDTENIAVTTIKAYVPNTTDSLIMSSLQPSATIHYTLQVVDSNNITIGSITTGTFVITSSLLPSMTSIATTTSLVVIPSTFVTQPNPTGLTPGKIASIIVSVLVAVVVISVLVIIFLYICVFKDKIRRKKCKRLCCHTKKV